MLAAITYQLREALEARGVPFPVVYGPQRLAQSVLADPHVVVERDRQQGDTVRPPTVVMRNPRLDHVRGVGAVVRVFAKSGDLGAKVEDHERVADHVLDQVLVALRAIVAARRTWWRIKSARLLSGAELEAREILGWPGVVYELRCEIDRGVTDANYAGEGRGEKSPTDIKTSLDTSGSPGPSTSLPGATTR